MEDVKGYLTRRGVALKRAPGGDEYVLPCPKCNESSDCSINSTTGLWHCFRASCGAGGNLYQLQVAYGDAYAAGGAQEVARSVYRPARRPVKPPEEIAGGDDWRSWATALASDPRAQVARDYLASRCLTEATLEVGRIGWRPSPDRLVGEAPNGVIAIPIFREPSDDSPAMVKLRWVPPEPIDPRKGKPMRYQRIKGGTDALFAPLGLKPGSEPVLVCGGELDALSALQALSAINESMQVVAPTTGEGSWTDELLEQLSGCEDIVIALDNDPPGRKAAEKLALQLGRHRCRIATWGKKDANATLVAGELDAFDVLTMIGAAAATGSEGVVSIGALADRLVAELFGAGSPAGKSTGILALDRVVGGIRSGEVIVLTGETGTGKTTFATQLGLYRASCGDRVLWCPFEIGSTAQAELLAWQYLGRDPHVAGEVETRRALAKLESTCRVLDHYGAVDQDKLESTLRYACGRAGVDLVIIDHLDYAAGFGAGQWDRHDSLIAMLQRLVLEMSIAMIVVKHPDKGGGKQQQAWGSRRSSDERVVQMGDLKGRSTARQDFANVWSLWRPRDLDRKSTVDADGTSEAGIVILKNRSRRGTEDTVPLRYNTATVSYSAGTATKR